MAYRYRLKTALSDSTNGPCRDLYVENCYLRKRLSDLLVQARKNEDKSRRLGIQEFRLISAKSLSELVKMVVDEYKASADLDAVTLALVDPDGELRRMLEDAGLCPEESDKLVFLPSADPLGEFFGVSLRPVLGRCRRNRHRTVFGAVSITPESAALLPLVRRGELIGSLNLGSRDAQRFVRGTATDFLERLAAIVAVCLENAANSERLKRIGLTDPLTRVNNRRFFEQRYDEEIAHAQRHGQPLTCMFLDLDRFKTINDSLGHQIGDHVLREAAALIQSQLRASDVLARYGGEEFVVILPNTTLENAEEIAERIRSTIAHHTFATDGIPAVTISIGLATHVPSGEAAETAVLQETLIAAADTALYQAKEDGRNRVVGAPLCTRPPSQVRRR